MTNLDKPTIRNYILGLVLWAGYWTIFKLQDAYEFVCGKADDA